MTLNKKSSAQDRGVFLWAKQSARHAVTISVNAQNVHKSVFAHRFAAVERYMRSVAERESNMIGHGKEEKV